jgi:hypothetical protein
MNPKVITGRRRRREVGLAPGVDDPCWYALPMLAVVSTGESYRPASP